MRTRNFMNTKQECCAQDPHLVRSAENSAGQADDLQATLRDLWKQ
jgi:hypothetical protein